MQLIKKIARNLLKKTGYNISRNTSNTDSQFFDMTSFLRNVECPVIFDVGANIGQSVDVFKKSFPDSFIHSFEPSPSTFEKLKVHCDGMNKVKLWNFGVGANNGQLPFQENNYSDMSSFLSPGELCWGAVEKVTNVDMLTLDSFTKDQNINFIHILKSDTQGFDFEVFKGAERLMDENKIALIFFEVIFSNMYKDLPPFYEVFKYLSEHKFLLVGFHDPCFQKNLLSWTNVLFINADYYGQLPD